LHEKFLKILSRKYTANPDILKKVLEDGRKNSALDHKLSHVFGREFRRGRQPR
jgi:hypothetical protein